MPSRRGKFSSSLRPFGGLVSDLSVYQLAAPAPAPAPAPTYYAPAPTYYAPAAPAPNPYVNEPWSDPKGPGLPAGSSWTSPEPGEPWIYTPPPPPESPTVAPEIGALPVPVIPDSVAPSINYTQAAANVAKMQGFVDILQAVSNPTAAQKAALKTDLAQLAKNQATLASLTGG